MKTTERGQEYGRLALHVALGATAFPAALWLPMWAEVAYFAFLGSWIVLGVNATRPGRCVICGTRRRMRMPLPRSSNHRRSPAWWDLRPERRSDTVWVCVDDFETYVRMRVHHDLPQ